MALAIGLLVFAVGAVLIGTAWQRIIVSVDPCCARCKFSLRGHEPWPQSCPECGASLTKRGGVGVRRVTSRWRAVLGLVLVIAGLFSVGPLEKIDFEAWGRSVTKWWRESTPLFVVRGDLRDGTPSAAWEVRRRLIEGDLDAGDAADVLADCVAAMNGALAPDDNFEESVLLMLLWQGGLISDEEMRTHLQAALNALISNVAPSPRIGSTRRVGEPGYAVKVYLDEGQGLSGTGIDIAFKTSLTSINRIHTDRSRSEVRLVVEARRPDRPTTSITLPLALRIGQASPTLEVSDLSGSVEFEITLRHQCMVTFGDAGDIPEGFGLPDRNLLSGTVETTVIVPFLLDP